MGNTIVHTFLGEYEVQRTTDVNLGLLADRITCYNGANSTQDACLTTAPTLPIKETDAYNFLYNSSGGYFSYSDTIATPAASDGCVVA